MYSDDPSFSSSSALVDAVNWFEAMLLGSVGTTIAVLAVAAVGLLILSGRLPVRRGAMVILGCFILFSATTVANGLTAGASYADLAPAAAYSSSAPVYRPSVPQPVPYDPYAGASVPQPALRRAERTYPMK